ncbi:MAG: TM0106 family RecB-like putative nuclease [Candidatus Eisenbacteria bacterium]
MSAPVAPRSSRSRRVTASTLYTLHQCERRLWLDVHAPDEGTPPTAFNEDLRRRGVEHERAVRAQFHGLIGPIYTWDDTTLVDAAAETRRLLRETLAPLYQPAFVSDDGALAGVPDFVEHDGAGGVVLRDAKLLTRLEGHPEVNLQMAHYRALVESTTGLHVSRCEIVSGHFEPLRVEPIATPVWETRVERARELMRSDEEPRLLKAHSVCEGCPFYEHCWDRATREGWLEILPGVSAVTRPRLEQLGIHTLEQLAGSNPAGIHGRGIGERGAEHLVLEARAALEHRPQWLGGHGLPVDRTPVWLDLEGDPGADPDMPIYMWGVGVDGPDAAIDYRVVIAAAGEGGDRDAWERFLALAREVFAAHPDAVWVHYADFERTWIKRYVASRGDPDGTAARVLAAMLDLHQTLQCAVVLPLRSYSIKWVAPHLGFEWRNPEASSQWSTVQYLRARATPDPTERERLFAAIAEYNEDDLLAMREVWQWMVREAPPGPPARGPKPARRSRRSGRRAG